MSSYYYPLIGGTMMATSVYHLLYYNGKVLGISGIYGGAISDVIDSIRRSFATSRSAKQVTAQFRSETDSLSDDSVALATRNSKIEKGENNEATGSRWKVSFVVGLLAGGTLLRLAQAPLEIRLGIPIFEKSVIQGVSVSPLASVLSGLLVGIGTKVIRGLRLYTKIKLSKGCTSGHMLCGVSRLSLRSIVATTTFFASAVGTVRLLNPQTSIPTILQKPFDPLAILLLQIPLVVYRYIVPIISAGKWYEPVSSFFISVHFAFALALAGMLQPSKIQNFLLLPFSSNFDPALLSVAVGALVPLLLGWVIKLRSTEKPLFKVQFNLPSHDEIDCKLIVGAVFFGIGWGWTGICPGSGVVNFGAYAEQWRTIGAWLLGMTGGQLLVSRGLVGIS